MIWPCPACLEIRPVPDGRVPAGESWRTSPGERVPADEFRRTSPAITSSAEYVRLSGLFSAVRV